MHNRICHNYTALPESPRFPTSVLPLQGCHGVDPGGHSSAQILSASRQTLQLEPFTRTGTYPLSPPVVDVEEEIPTPFFLW